jgi:hypothetical protein
LRARCGYSRNMRDRLFYPLAFLAAAAMVALALVWPQGLGTTSPEPFGHPMGPAPAPDAAKPVKAAIKALTQPPGGPSAAKPGPKLRPPIESTAP